MPVRSLILLLWVSAFVVVCLVCVLCVSCVCLLLRLVCIWVCLCVFLPGCASMPCVRLSRRVRRCAPVPLALVQPDENAYKAAIIACSGANQWGRALSIFRTFRRATSAAGGAATYGGGMQGGTATSPIIATDGASAATAEAVVPGTAIYNAVIAACGRGLYTEEALGFFAEMAELGVPRDEVRSTNTEPPMHRCCYAGYLLGQATQKAVVMDGLVFSIRL